MHSIYATIVKAVFYVVSMIYGSFYDKTEIDTLCNITQPQVYYMLESAFG